METFRASTRRCIAVALVGAAFALVPAAGAQAATFKVTTTADAPTAGCATNGACSLRSAVAAANATAASDTVRVPAGTFRLTSGQLLVTSNAPLTVLGAGARQTVVNGGGSNRVFDATGSPLNLQDLAVTGGNSGLADGGGVFVDEALSLQRVIVRGNRANFSGGGIGTDDLSSGAVTISNSTISGNTVSGTLDGQGGGVAVDNASLTIVNSTVSGNLVSSAGNNEAGGVHTVGPAGFVRLVNTTIAGNTAATGSLPATGGGLAATPPAPPLTATNTIIAGNRAGSVARDCQFTTPTPVSHNNISGDASCGFNDAGSKRNTNPGLGPLMNNGGLTDTRKFGLASAALDSGTTTGCPGADQRGVVRPQRGRCDIGAVELAPPTVSTGAARGVSANQVTSASVRASAAKAITLTGTMSNPLVTAGTSYFQVGRTTAYGRNVGVATLAAGASGVARSVPVSSLTPGALYHYRLVAQNADGVTVGRDAVLRTARRPRVRISGISAGCVTRSFRIRVRTSVARRTKLRSVRVRVDGKLVKRSKRRSFRVRINAGRLRGGRHRISVRATDRGGRTRVVNRSFFRCRRMLPRFTG